MIQTLDRFLEAVARAYLVVSQAFLAILVVGIFAEVIMRYFFATSVVGSGEIANLAIVWIVFLMAAVLHRRRRHIMITALVDLLGQGGKRAADVLVNIGAIVLAAYIFYQFYNVWPFLRLKTPVFHIPDVAFKSAPLFAFVPMLLQSLINLVAPMRQADTPPMPPA